MHALPPPTPNMETCIMQEAARQQIVPAVIMAVLGEEGGQVGEVRHDSNNSIDVGPMQVNSIWFPRLATMARVSESRVQEALMRGDCTNIAVGAWILRLSLERSDGNLWRGLAHYRSGNHRVGHPYAVRIHRRLVAMAMEPTHNPSIWHVPAPTKLAPIALRVPGRMRYADDIARFQALAQAHPATVRVAAFTMAVASP